MRATLDPASAHAMVVVTPSNGVAFQFRSLAGGASSNTNTRGFGAPCWVRLTRRGSSFTSFYSLDGIVWTKLGQTTVTMPPTVYLGVALTSHNPAALSSAVVDNVSQQ